MNRMPLSKDPIDQYLLVKMAYIDSFSLGVSTTFFGAAACNIRPESLVFIIFGLVFLYLFISEYSGKNEISVLRKNIQWFNIYSAISYASAALVGFFIPFDSTSFIAIVGLFPVLFNTCLIRPLIAVKIYKSNYTRLFGIIDA